jgi:hypothetical protein
MEYEGSIGFVSRKNFIAEFHVSRLLIAIKSDDLSDFFFRLSRAVAVERKICATPTA